MLDIGENYNLILFAKHYRDLDFIHLKQIGTNSVPKKLQFTLLEVKSFPRDLLLFENFSISNGRRKISIKKVSNTSIKIEVKLFKKDHFQVHGFLILSLKEYQKLIDFVSSIESPERDTSLVANL